MRITGGTLRSRRLFSIDSTKLRPATDRLRETMFNILGNMVDLAGSTALDLYAGTGSVGFETLSRGAARVVFVEADRKIAAVIGRNAEALGVKEQCDIRIMNADRYVATAAELFDVAYVDPPYAINSSTHEIIEEMLRRHIMNPSGIICVEHSKSYSPPPALLIRQKVFGSTLLSFIKPETK
jgi:16S rRNA (guanine966-N2)-methyltransferase